jgi:hypothetical protein
MLNRFENNLKELIKSYSDVGLDNFQGPNGRAATLDDLVWYFVEPGTNRKIRFLCTKHYGVDRSRRLRKDSISDDHKINAPYDKLLKIFIINLVCAKSSALQKQAVVISARTILSNITGHLSEVSESGWAEARISGLFQFCKEKHLIPGNLNITQNHEKGRDRTGEEIAKRRSELVPSASLIVALGVIFVEVFKDVGDDGKLAPGATIDIREALTCTYALLCLASPNRAAAEVPLLSKQQLKTFSESEGEPVHYLDWFGSKGFKNNKNHILKCLSEPLSRAINFFYHYCEPNRILANYYINQNCTWEEILGLFVVPKERSERLDFNRRPNLFTLAYALGFYDVYQAVKTKPRGECQISSLLDDTLLNIRYGKLGAFYSLFEVTINNLNINKDYDEMSQAQRATSKLLSCKTVKELEQWWIAYFKDELYTTFPLGFTASKSNNAQDMLFCFSGKDVYDQEKYLRGGGKPYDSSLLNIMLPNNISGFVGRQLNSEETSISIFSKHGFGDELFITPHKFRHFANTVAFNSDIPVEIITAWSGRKSVNQTRDYIHTTEADKSERIRMVLNISSDVAPDIRVITMNELSKIGNLPASVTSTGVCTQELNLSPCEYLNDFVSQCFMCPAACHAAQDDSAIAFLEKDYRVQVARLERVRSDPKINSSKAMSDWYFIHYRNTSILSALIELMKKYESGTIIRYSNRTNEFKAIDLNLKCIETVRLHLPDSDEALKIQLITSIIPDSQNDGLTNLLAKFGLE